MGRTSSICLLVLLLCCADVHHKVDASTPFGLPFYDQLMKDLEFYDAEAIATRNRTKSISWQQYKVYYRNQLASCSTAACAKETFVRFAEGFVNLHSQFAIIGYRDARIGVDSVFRAQPQFVIEYPSLRCYESGSLREITHLNAIPVIQLVNQFTNYQCQFSCGVGCATDFINRLNANWLTLNNRPLHTITYLDGSVTAVEFKKVKRPKPIDRKKEFRAAFKDWQVIAEGHKFVLLGKGKTLLVKYSDFLYDQIGGEVYCPGTASKNSFCWDVHLLTEKIRAMGPVETLVVDLQNNGGGVEITPLLAALAKEPFYDPSIRFRKTPALENDTIRPYLLWSNVRLENWFSALRKQESYHQTAYGSFLPSCADFCRGAENCEVKPIESTGKLAINRIVLVTNSHCVSSCDDFVWRMKAYANAIVAGQPHAADATYSRITLAYYQNQGQIHRKEFGPGQPIPGKNLFFTATVPNSATVDREGNPMQGIPVELDYEVPLVKEHFQDKETYTLSQVLKQYRLIDK